MFHGTTLPSINFYFTSEYQQYPPLNNSRYAKTKKKLKNSHRVKRLFARKLLVGYIPLFVVWFARITILTSTDIQIKDRITLIPITVAFVLLYSPFFCFLILSAQPYNWYLCVFWCPYSGLTSKLDTESVMYIPTWDKTHFPAGGGERVSASPPYSYPIILTTPRYYDDVSFRSI